MAAGRRVKTGCNICRVRRVKCDETHPVCKNCSKKARPCTYPSRSSRQSSQRLSTEFDPGVIANETPEDLLHNGSINTTLTESTNIPPTYAVAHEAEGRGRDSACVSGGVSTQQDAPDSLCIAAISDGELEGDLAPICDLDALLRFSEHRRLPIEPLVAPAAWSTETPVEESLTDIAEGTSSAQCLQLPLQVRLKTQEAKILRNYVDRVSLWIDSFSHDKPFHRIVPVLALHCPPLLNSCLALSSRQMSLVDSAGEREGLEDASLSYYRQALRSLTVLIAQETLAKSDEVLAASIILSTYEMLDPTGKCFGSHLQGITSLLKERQINGSSPGIRGAAYWTWYRHEVWATLQTKQRMTLNEMYWEPEQLHSFRDLNVENIANRVIYIFGQCLSLCCPGSVAHDQAGPRDSTDQYLEAAILSSKLDDWRSKLPEETDPVHVDDGDTLESTRLWFLHPQRAVSHQVYHASKVVLALIIPPTLPHREGLSSLGSLSVRREIEVSRKQIVMVSDFGVHEAYSLLSTQCLYVAGLVTEGIQERLRTLTLIEDCERSSGRRTICIADDLRRWWMLSSSNI